MLRKLPYLFLAILLSLAWLSSCSDENGEGGVMNEDPIEEEEVIDLTDIPYDPQPYDLQLPPSWPDMPIPADNPLTVDGVELGRHLFYDPVLSADSTQSCASCHLPSLAFTDGKALSVGIDGIPTRRSSMSLLNVGYYQNGLFWDGRVQTLEEQALLPVEDPVELHNTWPNVLYQLRKDPEYREMFRKAFGIENTDQMTKELAAKAMAQFERIILSSGESKYDKFLRGEYLPTDDETAGMIMFFDEGNEFLPDAECGHCHTGFLMTINEYRNNGIDSVGTTLDDLNNFSDKGHGAVTGKLTDNGKFRIPTLRNIMQTAPYMNDGRFETIEEVIDHYSSGGNGAVNEDPLIYNIDLSEQEKAQIIAFLHMLTDEEALTNPAVQNPFTQ